ncbi:reprolysin-like metallopeptidase [Ekhidna sp.]
MKKIFTFLAIIPHLLLAQETTGLWKDISSTSARIADIWQEIPSTKKQLNKDVLNSILGKVKTHSKATITIPTPEGSDSYFEIMESSVLAPKLQAKYPNIRTYKGINEKGEKIRLNIGVNGFRATVFSDEGAYGINPESTNSDIYVSYRWADYNHVNDVTSALGCSAEGKTETEIVDQLSARTTSADFTPRRTGDFHTKLRMAIIPDLNYVDHFGGTVEGALTGIATTVNTVNEIYERDASISFELIENLDEIIYTKRSEYENEEHYEIINTANIDPLTALLNELIGVENYDIGHHFLKDRAGGIAAVSSVCKDNDKALGQSGSNNGPEGYYFDVSIFAHEIGHQLGALHTYAASCGRRHTPDDAYEIGSGATIMGYDFGCAGYNYAVFPVLDYLHVRSIEKVIGTIENNCGESIATGNIPPTVSISESGFTIPINTPFILEADGNDADGDAITYCWEQYDRATKIENVRYAAIGEDGEVFETVEEYQTYSEQYLTDLENEFIEQGFTIEQYGSILSGIAATQQNNIERFWEGDGPLFRSFNPTENNKRYFPELSKVIDGTADNLSFEVMPHKTRDLNFVVTVRDNSILGAGIASDIVSFSSSDQAGPFVVTTQFSDPSYNGLSNVTLQWDVANTDKAPVNCQAVDIFYSSDEGESFDVLLVEGTPNDGEATIKLPNLATSKARIMVKASNNVFFNVNDRNFRINPSEVDSPESPATLAGTLSNMTIELSWGHSGDLEDGFIIERKSETNNDFEEIGRVPLNTTEYEDVTANINETNEYRVAAFNATGNSAYSNTISIEAIPLGSSLDLQKELDLVVYPNPTGHTLYVTVQKDVKVYLTDLSGRKVTPKQQGRYFELDMNDLQKGLYLLLVQYDDQVISYSVINN